MSIEPGNGIHACSVVIKVEMADDVGRVSLAMAMYPRVAEVVPDFGQGCPHRWPSKSPPGCDLS